MAPHTTRNSQLTDIEVNIAMTSQNIQQEPQEQESLTPTLHEPITPTNTRDDNDNDPPSNPFTQQSTLNLAQAIMLMTNELCYYDAPLKPFNTQVKQPDTFDGSDPKKLNNFILLCNLYFHNNPAYSEDDAKVTFSLTLLWGTALEFFEPMLSTDQNLSWENDWKDFICVLCNQFRSINPTADAEDNIDNLRMKDNQLLS